MAVEPIEQLLAARFEDHISVARETLGLTPSIAKIGDILLKSLIDGGPVLLCGNGGSATDADHLAGEIVGRYLLERDGWPAIALASSTSTVTAVANDYGYEEVFARQVKAFATPSASLIAISTSGNSKSILRAIEVAKAAGIPTIGFTGVTGGLMAKEVDVLLNIPSKITARIQEMHMLIGHILCEYVEAKIVNK